MHDRPHHPLSPALTSTKNHPFFRLDHFDIQQILQALTTVGGISIPLLQEPARLALLAEAQNYSYQLRSETIQTGRAIVRQEYHECGNFPADSLHIQLKIALQTLLAEQFATLHPNPLTIPIEFNAMVLQHYETGDLGITPHRDSLRAINLIGLCNLAGQAQFCLCADRQGNQPIELDTTPGNIILLRAPGFLHASMRPFHYVHQFRSTRYSLGLRQRVAQPLTHAKLDMEMQPKIEHDAKRNDPTAKR
jgi:hypothetical protein